MSAVVKNDQVLSKTFIPAISSRITESTFNALMFSCLLGMDHAAETLALAAIQILPDSIPFVEAINYMASKVPLTKAEYYSLSDQLKFRAFTVGRLTQVDAVERVRHYLVKAVSDGRSLSEFQTQTGIDEAMKVAGFDEDSPWYWETVYRTNIQTAYNTGRLMQYEKNPPEYLEFIGIGDIRQTDICRIRMGTILPFGDQWWENNYPPLHFNCRSTIRAIYKEEAQIRGSKKTEKPKGDDPPGGFGMNPVKSGSFFELTTAMKERAIKYGIDTDFINAAVDANLANMARELIKEGMNPTRILFEKIDNQRLRLLAEESINTDVPLRTEGRELVEKYKDQITYRLSRSEDYFYYPSGHLVISERTLKEARRHSTFRHEFGHALDHRVFKEALSGEDEFVSVLKRINTKLIGKHKDEEVRSSVIKFINEHANDSSVSDLFCSLTGRKDSALHGNYVHPANYYSSYKRRAVECFANLFDLYCVNDNRWESIREILPDLTNAFEVMIAKL